MREQRLAYIMLLPAFIVLVGIIGYPLFFSIGLSFTDTWIGKKGSFIGLGNYIELVHEEFFWQVARNSAIYTSISLAFKTMLGLFLALILTKIRGRTIFQAILLLPWVIPSSLSSLMWWWMYNSQFGAINDVLRTVGMSSILWLARPFWARVAVITVNIWRGLPFFAMCFLAGLMSISREFYEAAEIDGAGARARFWFITLPLLKPILGIVFLYSLVRTIADFEIVWIITKGGPLDKTHLFGTLAFQFGLVGTKIGKGAAISLFLFPVLAVSAYFFVRIILRRSGEVG